MVGIIDVGGGLRGIYGAGILDYCLDNNIEFDMCVGVSAGAANMISYIAGQKGRNYLYYNEYAFRKEYISLSNFRHTGSYLDLDYVYGELSNRGGENPLDYPEVAKTDKKLVVVATNAKTGRPKYFGLDDIQQDNYDIFKASACVPIANKPYEIQGIPYFDGGVADPIPVEYALDHGCDKVVVILTKPRDFYRQTATDQIWAKMIEHAYPRFAQTMSMHAQTYNDQLDLAKLYEAEGKVQILAPSNTATMGTFDKDRQKLDDLYHQGYKDAEKIRFYR